MKLVRVVVSTSEESRQIDKLPLVFPFQQVHNRQLTFRFLVASGIRAYPAVGKDDLCVFPVIGEKKAAFFPFLNAQGSH